MQTLAKRLRAFGGDFTTTRLPLGATTLLRPDFSAARAFGADPLSYLRSVSGGRDAVRLQLGFSGFVFVSSPDLVKRILVSDDRRFGEGKWTQRGQFVLGDCIITREGQSHSERRKLIQPGFKNFGALSHPTAMATAISDYSKGWRHGDALEMRREMGRMALAIACVFLFEEDPQTDHPEVLEDLWIVNSAISRPPVPGRRLKNALGRLRASASRMRRGTIVQQLRGSGLGEDDIDREIIALMVASIDTTPSTLCWIWNRLAQHPEVESALHRELAEHSSEGLPAVTELSRFEKLKGIVTEVLRLHPPVRFIDRRALENMKLGDIEVSAGDYILISPLLNQRDARFWEQPDDFCPDRWRPGSNTAFERFSYFPFGAGPHACIGGALAQREIDMVVATLACQWRFRLTGPAPNPHLVPSRFDMRVEARR